MFDKDTIAAISTAAGQAGIGVIRISGDKARSIAEKICQTKLQPRYAHFLSFHKNKQILDQGICLYFKKPHSFTGEDVVELQAHGGVFLLNLLLKEIINLGARLAHPGEFSARAFLNNKIDLVQAEAIADLIEAHSESAARNAISNLQGNFSKHIHTLVEQLIQLRTYLEAIIDFPEEEIDFIQNDQIQLAFTRISLALDNLIKNAKQGNLIKEGIKAVLIGKPNAGKSSLLNALVEKDVAIVTAIQGTTRDVLREHILIEDMPVHLIDTAGLRHSEDLIEQEGVRRAIKEIEQADLVILVNDISEIVNLSKTQEDIELLSKNLFNEFPLLKNIELGKIPKIIVHNKVDLIGKEPSVQIGEQLSYVYLSAKNQAGITLLKNLIKTLVCYQGFADTQETIFSVRQRHYQALEKAAYFLKSAKQQLQLQAGELLAEDLRQCQQALSEITGEFNAEDLLGRIFSSFCIGK